MRASSQEVNQPIVDRVRDRDTGHLGHKRGVSDSIEGFTEITGNDVDIRIVFKQISNSLKNRDKSSSCRTGGPEANWSRIDVYIENEVLERGG